ncbi:acyl-CoA dehydrogenase family protein [Phyllobacterium sp. SB3]|uniref:acyl-CoA dehydrogenase family protein n=1 Tax=Phyllobacterium sp. SB3 TaxID=3156073 RepID=UPI0032AF41CF
MSDHDFVWPHVPTEDFEHLAEKFRPVFDEIREGAVARDRDRSLPHEAVALLRKSGFGALRVPKEFGGFGTSLTTLFALLTELAEADSNVTQILRGHFGFVEIVLHNADGEWSRRWLTLAGKGELFAPAHTEPGDSQHGRFSTAVTGEGNRLELNGTKYYATGALYADWIHVTANRGDTAVTVLVPTNAEGVTIVDDWDGFGQALTASGTVTYDHVSITQADIQPAIGRAAHVQSVYQLIHLATLSGIGRAAVRETTTYLVERSRTYAHGNTETAKQDPQILQVIGEVISKVFGANTAMLTAASASQRFFDKLVSNQASEEYRARLEIEVYQAQVTVATQILEATTALFGGLGASALSRERGFDRFWRNARAITSHNPLIYRSRQIGDFTVNGTPPSNQFSLPLPSNDRDVESQAAAI